MTGLFIIFKSASLLSYARIDILFNSWAIRLAKRLYVLGILVSGLILITWLEAVVTKT